MSLPAASSDLTVAQILRGANQNLAAVFISRKTACVGCYLARFCTLGDVARNYGIPLDELLDELQRAGMAHTTIMGAENA